MLRPHCGYCAERTRKIVILARIFYSVRKHMFHPLGADGVMRDMIVNLELIRSWSNLWEQHGK
ncbi:hypothetical protein G3N64_08555 [Burkholderia sp. Ac-20344]|nr:hypothetical protein [Burkholderia sp. Ac-20344]